MVSVISLRRVHEEVQARIKRMNNRVGNIEERRGVVVAGRRLPNDAAPNCAACMAHAACMIDVIEKRLKDGTSLAPSIFGYEPTIMSSLREIMQLEYMLLACGLYTLGEIDSTLAEAASAA